MLRVKRNNKVIADYDIGVTDDWYPIDVDPNTGSGWPAELAAQLAPTDAVTATLTARLVAVQDTMRSMNAPRLSSAVWVPEPQSGEIASVLAFGLVEIIDGEDAETYRATLAADERRIEDGVEFLDVRTWTAHVDAGFLVGAYNKISHLQPSGEAVVEERTVFGVFPPCSKEMIECIFIAQSGSSYDDFIAETQSLVATITVELEKA